MPSTTSALTKAAAFRRARSWTTRSSAAATALGTGFATGSSCAGRRYSINRPMRCGKPRERSRSGARTPVRTRSGLPSWRYCGRERSDRVGAARGRFSSRGDFGPERARGPACPEHRVPPAPPGRGRAVPRRADAERNRAHRPRRRSGRGGPPPRAPESASRGGRSAPPARRGGQDRAPADAPGAGRADRGELRHGRARGRAEPPSASVRVRGPRAPHISLRHRRGAHGPADHRVRAGHDGRRRTPQDAHVQREGARRDLSDRRVRPPRRLGPARRDRHGDARDQAQGSRAGNTGRRPRDGEPRGDRQLPHRTARRDAAGHRQRPAPRRGHPLSRARGGGGGRGDDEHADDGRCQQRGARALTRVVRGSPAAAVARDQPRDGLPRRVRRRYVRGHDRQVHGACRAAAGRRRTIGEQRHAGPRGDHARARPARGPSLALAAAHREGSRRRHPEWPGGGVDHDGGRVHLEPVDRAHRGHRQRDGPRDGRGGDLRRCHPAHPESRGSGSRAVVLDRAHDDHRLQQLPLVPRPRDDTSAIPLGSTLPRVLAVTAVAAALAFALATPALADEGWVIQRFASDITIQTDASLHIVEAIEVDFGAQQKHGIFRNIPVRYRWDDTHLRVYRLEVRSVTDASEKPIKFSLSDAGADKVIKIGDPDRTVSGRQTYRITYDVSGAMNAFADHDELFWNVNGGSWDVRAQAVTATVHAPAALQRVTCYQGPAGSDEACRATTTASGAEFAATRPFPPRGQLTIVGALAKGVVAEPAPMIARDGGNVLGYFESQRLWLALAAFVLVAGLALLYWRWYTAGRDPGAGQTIVPEYEPPDKIRPAQLGVILDESADTKDVTATIVDLAVRGYLTITEEPQQGIFGKKDWTLHATGKGRAGLLPYEGIVYDGLFKDGADVKISELRTNFVTSLRSAESELYHDSHDRKWFATRPDRVRQGYAGLSVLVIIAGAVLAWLLGRTLGAGLIGVAVIVVGFVALGIAPIMPAKTAAGADLHRRALGFGRYMEVAETEGQRFAERENIFSDYLPYAIVFGCVDRWARAFKDIDMSKQTASWYIGSGPFNAGVLSSSLQGFSSNLGSAIAATTGSSGGSGFSGGGAGGGGGGGGGGSW